MAVSVDKATQEFVNLGEQLRKEEDEDNLENAEPIVLQSFFEDSVRTSLGPGGKLKKMGVIVKNLTVIGKGADAIAIPSNLDIFKNLYPLNWFKKKGTPFNILNNISAYCKDGEMLLVLGRPGAGCSSFLRVVANQIDSFSSVQGDISYGGIPAGDFREFSGEAIYTPEEDAHYPSLSLKETLTFALRMKTPGKRFPGQSKRNFRQIVFNSLMTMFGLTHQVNTQVGNEYIRGLSGGERKRLTITEAMVAKGAIECWDGSTRGLDAASALDYARSLRVLTDSLHKTTIASFYQASEAIYSLFDRVLLLDKGRAIYFGPTKEAKDYFYNLGFECENRKSTPDFLTGISNVQERKIRDGFENLVPQTSVDLERAYKESDTFARVQEEIKQYEEEINNEQPSKEFKEAVKDAKAKRARKQSKYSASLWEQFTALLIRQAQITWGDKFELFSRYFSALIQALLYGSIFFNMPMNAVGGYARTGALFGALIDTALISQSEVVKTFIGRRILQKQHSYAMFHPSLFHLSQVALDIPVMILQAILFSLITYFMFGLDVDAGKFFVYLLTITLVALCITNFYRLIGNLSPTQYLSEQLSNVCFILMFLYSGFAPVKPKMKPWLSWIFWINPYAYAFKSLISNEMRNVDFECLSDGHVPYGANYTNPDHRVCALSGALPGETKVSGKKYTEAYMGFDIDLLGVDLVALFLFWILFTVLNTIAVEKLQWNQGGHLQKIYKKGKAPKQNDVSAELENAKAAAEATANMKPFQIRAGVFLWNEINYTVPTKNGKRLLLDNVFGWIKPGQMTALMGSSGAGKTTLLDVLAQRKTLGEVRGTMLLDGLPLRKDFERITGYVEQMDVHDPLLTVRESLRFSALLRQETDVTIEDKYSYVEDVLNMMEMKDLGDALVGDLESGFGISVEERRRLSIGMELVAKPQILFLDEPTSGLDAQSSYNIIKFVRKLADTGMPLVCTIHQPSSLLFNFFDCLILLGKGGKMVYFDDIGENSQKMLNYFENHGARSCSPEENPAEYILEAIRPGPNSPDWPDVWKHSLQNSQIQIELQQLISIGSKFESEKEAKEFATSTWTQISLVYKRFNITFWRNPSYMVGRILQSLMVGLAVGFSFWQLGTSTSDLNLYLLSLFIITLLGLTLITAAMPQFFKMRELFTRDYASKYYSSIPFSICAIAVEIPYLIIAASLCFFCLYWSCNFDTGTGVDGFFFWLLFVVFIIYCHTFGTAVAAASPNVGVAFLALPLIMGYLFLMCGALNPQDNMPKFYSSWLYHLNPFRYFMEAIVGTAVGPLQFKCSPEDFLKFTSPSGLTCGEYLKEFLEYSTGYIDNPEASGNILCNYCQYKNGSEFLDGFNWTTGNGWRNLGILVAYTVANIGAVIGFTHLYRKQAR